MLQRIGLIMIFFAACLCGSAYGQTRTAGCIICPGQGSGSGSNTGNSNSGNNSRNAAAAAMMNSMQNNLQNNTQMINNAGAAILNALQQNNESDADTTPNDAGADSGGQPADSVVDTSTSMREQINSEASQILQESQSYIDSTNGANGGEEVPSSNTAAAVNSLLDSGQPPSSSNSAVNSLLGDSAQPSAAATTPAGAIANLLDINKASDAASVFPAYVPLAPPDDPQFAAAMLDSVNQPDPSASGSLLQELQGTGQQVEDRLTGIVSSSRALASSVLDNRFVQWAMSDKGNFTTAPLPVPSESPNTAADLVYGQSVVGFGAILKQCVQNGPVGCTKGIKEYGTAMVNQMGADLGYAQVDIVQNPNPAPSN
jgi:hypothetical protein